MPSKLEVKQDRDFQAYVTRIARSVMYFDQLTEGDMFEGMQVLEIRVKQNSDGTPGFLVIVKALCEGHPQVAFTQGISVSEALISAAERIRNNSMKWREDRPWGT